MYKHPKRYLRIVDKIYKHILKITQSVGMKTLLVLVFTVVSLVKLNAQTCKIKIYYDDNGNRIQRVLDCTGERPAPPADNSPVLSNENEVMSNDSFNLNGFQVYPNPSESRINIKLDALSLASGNCNIALTDLSGKMLFSKNNIKEPVSVISLDGYTDGTYFVMITIGSKKSTVKIVKQTGSGY
jgi:hypothetical protein